MSVPPALGPLEGCTLSGIGSWLKAKQKKQTKPIRVIGHKITLELMHTSILEGQTQARIKPHDKLIQPQPSHSRITVLHYKQACFVLGSSNPPTQSVRGILSQNHTGYTSVSIRHVNI